MSESERHITTQEKVESFCDDLIVTINALEGQRDNLLKINKDLKQELADVEEQFAKYARGHGD